MKRSSHGTTASRAPPGPVLWFSGDWVPLRAQAENRSRPVGAVVQATECRQASRVHLVLDRRPSRRITTGMEAYSIRRLRPADPTQDALDLLAYIQSLGRDRKSKRLN